MQKVVGVMGKGFISYIPLKSVSFWNMLEKEIDAVDDIMDLVRKMTCLGVSLKGLRTLDEMKQRVKETLKRSEKKSSWTAKQVRFCRSG